MADLFVFSQQFMKNNISKGKYIVREEAFLNLSGKSVSGCRPTVEQKKELQQL